MDCIYKSNKYQLLLLNIIKTMYLNIIFYVTFRFLFQEKKQDFIWFLTILHILYGFLPFFIFYIEDWIWKIQKLIIINYDTVMIVVIREIFLYTTNL